MYGEVLELINLQQSLDAFQISLEKNNKNELCIIKCAKIALKLGAIEKSREHFERLKSLKKRNEKYRSLSSQLEGGLLAAEGKNAHACKIFSKHFEENPEN